MSITPHFHDTEKKVEKREMSRDEIPSETSAYDRLMAAENHSEETSLLLLQTS
jgi:hypothetical protein